MTEAVPQVGMLATVRHRRGVIASVEPFDGATDGRLHLVRVEYADHDGAPEETLLWEREPARRLTEPTALPRVGAEPPMPLPDFTALIRASRWGALTPFVSPHDPTRRSELPIAAPFFGAVQVEDFQLVPVLKALQMPRVSLLLADDVGLGKTIEAGLVLSELLIRRRVRRVLILTPAALRRQWQQEMRDKFSLSFDQIDRDETHALQRRLGLDANPWRTFPRVIASYYYLRQPDVLEQFRAACKQPDGSFQLPWDLLIVDEAHNLMPSAFGEDSDLAVMLRLISPWFEHKLFLTATPHNGHTRSFTGLLESLDPVRFTQKAELGTAERARVEEILVRRLKSEINALDEHKGRLRRFSERFLDPLPLFFKTGEQALSRAWDGFRRAVYKRVAGTRGGERIAGTFAVEVLGKRLLSCSHTFAESWTRLRAALDEPEADTATAAEVNAARRAAAEELDDDAEREGRIAHAARTVGAWLKPFAGDLASELAAVDKALARLGLPGDPREDVRLDRLFGHIDKHLRSGKAWRDDERLVVFTEYKTTLDYLVARLEARYGKGEAIRVLYGDLDMGRREQIKLAFNDSADPVRVLIATDAAAEGLNLQETARLLLHWDIPWNPSRLEQRNGRLDRHGQARDVTVSHFTSENDADLQFLARVVEKVNRIREDLGSLGEVFDAAFQRRFEDLEDADAIDRDVDAEIERRRGRAAIPRAPIDRKTAVENERLETLRRDIDLGPTSLRDTLEAALAVNAERPRLEGPDARGRMRLRQPIPRRWAGLVDDSLRLASAGSARGALPALVFDAASFMDDRGGRPVFRPQKDAVLLHLGHPIFREALATFARLRFPGDKELLAPSRFSVTRGSVPKGADAVVLFTMEELAVNELREPFHHWVRTLRYPVIKGRLGRAEPYVAPADETPCDDLATDTAAARTAATLWEEVEVDLRDALRDHSRALTATLRKTLSAEEKQAKVDEKRRYQERRREVEAALKDNSIAKVEREREAYAAEYRQKDLFRTAERERELLQSIAERDAELARRGTHYRELLVQLDIDEKRVVEQLLPKRYALRGVALVYPVGIELRLARVSKS